MADKPGTGDFSYPLPTYTSLGRTFQSASSTSNTDFDLLDLLGLAQSLGVRLLPIRPQPELATVGEGGTAQISQSTINIQTSFAFKQLKRSEFKVDEAQNLKALIAEVAILGHPAVIQHAHVVNLEGICFDVELKKEKVSPVLVFEKTACGDLAKFMTERAGRDLPLDARLGHLADIASAIRDLHSLGVIHGDIKPENVLVFSGNKENYQAKVTDFGYSTLFTSNDAWVAMPFSGIWTAPEHHYRSFTRTNAMKMDFYSFGMLSLWLLFYHQHSMSDWYSMRTLFRVINPLEQALKLLEAVEAVDNLKSRLQTLFESTLAVDPQQRCTDFCSLLRHISPDRTQSSAIVPGLVRMPSTDFELPSSCIQLIRSHFLVRQYLARCLENRIDQSHATSNHKFSLAFCYDVGFGVVRNQIRFDQLLLKEPDLSRSYRSQALQAISRTGGPAKCPSTLYETLDQQGFIQSADYSDQYEAEGLLQRAEALFREEIETLRLTLGDRHDFVQELRWQLYTVLYTENRFEEVIDLSQHMRHLESNAPTAPSRFDMELAEALDHSGRHGEAEKLLVNFQESLEKQYDLESPDIARIKSILASIYSHQGRWEEAEALETQIMETHVSILGPDHPSTMMSMSNLAGRYRNAKRWSDAEDMDIWIIARLKRLQGLKHQDTIMSMGKLAASYSDQHRWNDAERLEAQIMGSNVENLGPEHPDTVKSMVNLARIYFYQRRWNQAEQLQTRVVEIGGRILGRGHSDVLSTVDDLAITYVYLKEWSKSEQIQRLGIEWRTEYLGADHIETIESIDGLGAFLTRKDAAKDDDDDVYDYR